MTDIVIASTQADAMAAAAVERHHAEMAGALATMVEELVLSASRSDGAAAIAAQHSLAAWCAQELVPHALAEEKAMYPAAEAIAAARLLITAMVAEHGTIVDLVAEVQTAPDMVRAAAAARALQVTFTSHLAKENELILPLLVATPEVSVAELLSGLHELLGEQSDTLDTESGCGHSCTCGENSGTGYPELDARLVPHAIRHATIFGALDSVASGTGMVLVAPHDPLPLLAQIEDRSPGAFEVNYLERGPDAWRLEFVRT